MSDGPRHKWAGDRCTRCGLLRQVSEWPPRYWTGVIHPMVFSADGGKTWTLPFHGTPWCVAKAGGAA